MVGYAAKHVNKIPVFIWSSTTKGWKPDQHQLRGEEADGGVDPGGLPVQGLPREVPGGQRQRVLAAGGGDHRLQRLGQGAVRAGGHGVDQLQVRGWRGRGMAGAWQGRGRGAGWGSTVCILRSFSDGSCYEHHLFYMPEWGFNPPTTRAPTIFGTESWDRVNRPSSPGGRKEQAC